MSLAKHLYSVIIACLLVILLTGSLALLRQSSPLPTKFLDCQQTTHRGVLENLAATTGNECEFMASLASPEQITLFGSSEFGSSLYCPYYYLPDSLGIPVLALGHAHHQCFSILCELLAAREFLKDSKICIILSPSWFHTEGTNSEAFVEFVRPNFLKHILQDTQVQPKYKIAIGEFIYRNHDEFTGISRAMEYFIDIYQLSNWNLSTPKSWVRRTLYELHKTDFADSILTYRPIVTPFNGNRVTILDQDEYLAQIQKQFLDQITNNSLYVNDAYFSEFLLDSTGQVRVDSVDEISLENNPEYTDFELLVSLLDESNADVSFIIQPLNPYYYSHVDRNHDLVEAITTLLDSKEMPYLNLYANTKEMYEPGVLKDVMHLGDLGWMRINFFLDKLYHAQEPNIP